MNNDREDYPLCFKKSIIITFEIDAFTGNQMDITEKTTSSQGFEKMDQSRMFDV